MDIREFTKYAGGRIDAVNSTDPFRCHLHGEILTFDIFERDEYNEIDSVGVRFRWMANEQDGRWVYNPKSTGCLLGLHLYTISVDDRGVITMVYEEIGEITKLFPPGFVGPEIIDPATVQGLPSGGAQE